MHKGTTMTATARRPAPFAGAAPKILVIDDDAGVRAMLEEVLRSFVGGV